MTRFRLLTLALASIAFLAAAAGPSALGAVAVANQAELTSAVEQLGGAGGTIILRPTRYAALVVGPRSATRLTIVAPPGARAQRVVLCNTQAVTIRGLKVTPAGGHAGITVCNSRNIAFERLVVRGGGRLRSNVSVLSSSNVRFVKSTFTRCGEGVPPDGGYCLRARFTSGLTVAASRFHDCYGCDFIHGHQNAHVRVLRSSFDRSLVGSCGRSIPLCHHQDLIHLNEGHDFLFDGNRFGIYEYPGAAQIYLTGSIRRVTVTNNVFRGSDPRLPGYRAPDALWIGNPRSLALPRNVVIVHNTILTGRPRMMKHDKTPTATSIGFSKNYVRLPLAVRPIVANNVIGLAATPLVLCQQVQAFVGNVIVAGKPCGSTQVTGDARLDRFGRPTAASSVLIDRADLRYAVRHDIDGVPRGQKPDIGAFEFVQR
jgi:hypothetical protein